MENIKEALKYGLDSGFDDLEIYVEESEGLDIELREGNIEKFQESKSNGIGIRGIKDNKQALVFGNSLVLDEIKKNIDKALDIIPYMDHDESLMLNTDESFEGIIKEKLISGIKNKSTEEKIEYLKEIEGQGKGEGELKGNIESSSYGEVLYKKSIFNTKGLSKRESGAYCASSISLAIDKDGVKETGFSYFYNRDIDKLFSNKLGMEAYNKAKEMIGAKVISSGKYRVILNNEIVIDLLRLLGSSFNGENILKSKSMFKGKEGNLILSDKITIIDDGNQEGSVGDKYFDGEGTSVSKNIIVEKGVFNKGIYNLSVGKKLDTSTTGNCVRSYSSFPSVGFNSLSIVKGNDSLKELDASLIVKDLMGLHMANPITGEFSLGASGLIIGNGEVKGGFRGVTISGNLKDLFNDIVAVGEDFLFRGTTGAPSLVVENVIVSGS